MKLYYNPVSSYSQKTLMAFYEKGVSFEPNVVDLMNPEANAAYRKIAPLGKVPLLVLDDGWMIPESSIIIEYLDTHFDGPRLIPADPDRARQTRFFDRLSDLYLNDTMTTLLFEPSRKPEDKNPRGVRKAKETLDTMYALMDKSYATKTFAMGDEFTMADCAAAPCLFYLKRAYPYAQYPNVSAYADRLLSRPSYQKVMAEAKPVLERMFGAS